MCWKAIFSGEVIQYFLFALIFDWNKSTIFRISIGSTVLEGRIVNLGYWKYFAFILISVSECSKQIG